MASVTIVYGLPRIRAKVRSKRDTEVMIQFKEKVVECAETSRQWLVII